MTTSRTDEISDLPAVRGEKHILIVDDEWRLGRNIARCLRQRGYSATAVLDVRSALDEVYRNPPDCALVDLHLPGLSGIDLCASLHKHHPSLPVIIISALVEQHEREILYGYGVRAIVGKPFVLSELAELVQSCLYGPPQETTHPEG